MTTINTTIGALRDALKAQRDVIETRTAVPILTCVRIVPNGLNGLDVTGTDLDLYLTLTITGQGDGEIVLPMADALRVLDGETATDRVQIASKDGQATLTMGRDHYILDAYPPLDFPTASAFAAIEQEPIRAGILMDALTPARSCVSTEATRYYLCGVLFTEEAGKLVLVSTDGHRLAHAATPVPVKLPSDDRSTLMPTKAVTLALKRLKGEAPAAPIRLALGVTRMALEGDGWTLTTKVINGTFPDYTRVMPGKVPVIVSVRSEDMVPALKKLDKVVQSRTTIAAIRPAEQAVMTGFDGKERARLHVDMTAGPGAEDTPAFGVNATCLRDILTLLPGMVRLKGDSAANPFKIESFDTHDVEVTFVLMPMRVGSY